MSRFVAALAAAVVAGALFPVAALPQGAAAKSGPPHGDLQIDCAECHNPERWAPVDKPPSFRHEKTGFALQAAHARASCRGCHTSLVFNRVGTDCADCHRDAHRGEMGFQCDACHTPTTWTNQRDMFQAHARTRFPLFASHARLDCTACHRSQKPYEYRNTPAECGNCHLETYLKTTNPSHVQAGFPRRCEDCHNLTAPTWRSAVFSHPASFPLTGGHARLACARCHTSGSYAGTSSACASCHQADYARTTNPNHSAGRFPTTCENCHTTTAWRPATFDHDQSRFPLTGAHTRVDCARCHTGGRYQGTPTDCYSCHQASYAGTSNPNHAASGFPTDCASCHSTSAWRPASFDHDGRYFPIYSGSHRGRWSSCSDCHVSAGNYRAFECIVCHAHSNKAQVDRDHGGVNGYRYASSACYQCHRNGRADSTGDVRRLP
jgi:Zn finger protein HypA/HybF involved in hydrogenase expression